MRLRWVPRRFERSATTTTVEVLVACRLRRGGLRPASSCHGRSKRLHFARSAHFQHLVHPEPARGGDVKSTTIGSTEHAGEPATIKSHLVQYFAAFAHSLAASI